MSTRMTRSKKGLGNMMTRKLICDADDIKFHLISEEFDKISGKVKGSDNVTTNTNQYTISIDYFDNTTPDNTIKKNYTIPKKLETQSAILLFCQVDVLHINKDNITYSLKGIFSLLKSYCLAEGDAAIINNKAFKKDDLEYFLNIIYKCIVFSQQEEKEEAKNRFKIYAHFLFNIAKKVNLAIGDVGQNIKNRIIELSMPIDIVEDTFDMDKFERFINILAAVRCEYERREKELQEKINKFNLLGNKRQRVTQAEEPEAEQGEEEPAPAAAPEPAEEPEEPAAPAAEEQTAPEVKEEQTAPAAEEPAAPVSEEKKPPAESHNLPPFIYELIEGSTNFIEQIDELNVGFSKALDKNTNKLINKLAAEEPAPAAEEPAPATEEPAAEEPAAKTEAKIEDKLRHEEIAKNLLITVLIDMKEEQIREQLDNDLDEYFAARPLSIKTQAPTPAPTKALTPSPKKATSSPNYQKQQYYEQAVLCYNGVYTKQLLDHISGIATISDIDTSNADIFVKLINNLTKDQSIQSFIKYSKLNEMKKYYESYIAYLTKIATSTGVNAVNKEKKAELAKVTTAELEKVKAELAEAQEELTKVTTAELTEAPEALTAELEKVKAELAKVTTAELAEVTKAELAKAELTNVTPAELTAYQTKLSGFNVKNLDDSQKSVIASMNKVITLLTEEKLKQVIIKTIAVKIITMISPNPFQITMITNPFQFPMVEPYASPNLNALPDPLEIYLETIYDILESTAMSIISDMNFDDSNRAKEYNQYINLKNSYLSAFRADLINNANCGHKLEAMNMEYYDEPLISELCGAFGNKVCLGKRKEQAGGKAKSKKITINGKKYKIHVIDGKKYIKMDKKKVLLSEAKSSIAAPN